MTLDKFLNHGSLRKTEQCTQPDSATVIPVKLISVKKLIYEFENDSD